MQGVAAMLLLLLAVGVVGWLNQDFLNEQYYWRFTMKPRSLPSEQERTLKAGDEFSECANGCPPMLVIPGGKFSMGSPEGQGGNSERPQHEVTIAKPFAVGKYEVTAAEWEICVAAGGCPRGQTSGDKRPVGDVSWNDVLEYVTWLSRMTGKPYRLLSETEWEYVARGRWGTPTLYFYGDNPAELNAYAWYRQNSNGEAHPVGEKEPNGFGLYDVAGNVSEWVEDCYHDNYDKAPSDGSVWATGECPGRVFRGGSWFDFPDTLRSAYRNWFSADTRFKYVGFRIARTLDQ
jgi:formylglycine-generating enzyme required for sulfatase activity